jgi:hypothetical protein
MSIATFTMSSETYIMLQDTLLDHVLENCHIMYYHVQTYTTMSWRTVVMSNYHVLRNLYHVSGDFTTPLVTFTMSYGLSPSPILQLACPGRLLIRLPYPGGQLQCPWIRLPCFGGLIPCRPERLYHTVGNIYHVLRNFYHAICIMSR